MMAVHAHQPAGHMRPDNPMSISSMLNDHDRIDTKSFSLLFNQGQRSLPPMFVPNDTYISNTTTSGIHHLPYRTHSQYGLSPVESSPTTSNASLASRRGSAARAPRPKYSDDQGYFIWYHRTDLAEPWDKVLQEFEKQFSHRRPKGGLQCKFYRLLGDWGVEKVREQARQSQSRSRDSVGRYGLVQRTHLRFDWMKDEHRHAQILPQFEFAIGHPRSPGGSPCPGCHECISRAAEDSRARL